MGEERACVAVHSCCVPAVLLVAAVLQPTQSYKTENPATAGSVDIAYGCAVQDAAAGCPVIEVHDSSDLITDKDPWQRFHLVEVDVQVQAACAHQAHAVAIKVQPQQMGTSVWQTALLSTTLDRLQWRLPAAPEQQAPASANGDVAASGAHATHSRGSTQQAFQSADAAQEAGTSGAPQPASDVPQPASCASKECRVCRWAAEDVAFACLYTGPVGVHRAFITASSHAIHTSMCSKQAVFVQHRQAFGGVCQE